MLGDEQPKPVTRVTIICEDGETHKGWLSEYPGHNGIPKVRLEGPPLPGGLSVKTPL